MSEEYGNDFVVLTDEDGREIELEHLDTVEYNGQTYMAFLPTRKPRCSRSFPSVWWRPLKRKTRPRRKNRRTEPKSPAGRSADLLI